MRKSDEKGGEKKKYTEEEKRAVVMEYRISGNAAAVGRKHGVARTTLLSWAKLYASIPTDNPIVTDAVVAAVDKASDAIVRSIDLATASRQQFFAEHYAELSKALSLNLNAIISRLEDKDARIPYRDLAASLTALTSMVKEFLPVEEQQSTTQINLLQQTINN